MSVSPEDSRGLERSALNVGSSGGAGRPVFLSYAREDGAAAQRIVETLRAAGVEVWFDQSELRGGEAWDLSIRRQIKECALFVPLISAHTEDRHEGYFRLEWSLAEQRTHLMARGVPFILPVVIDATNEARALVPERFREVQWFKLPAGEPKPEFIERVKRLIEHPRKSPFTGHAVRAAEAALHPEPRTAQAPRYDSLPARRPARGRRWVWAAALAGVVIAAAVIFVLRQPARPGDRMPAKTSNVMAKSIAVLPFANLSAAAENESFAEGLHDDVITALSKIHDLTVISRTSVMTYKAGARNLKQIAGELGVGTVLEGSVQRAGNKIRLNVQLIDARTDAHLWAENYTEDISDVFAVQSRLATAITKALQATLSPQERALIGRRPTQNAEAYDLYQRGRQIWEGLGLGNTRANYERVVTLLEQAVAKDPGFAQAYAQLASLHGELYWFASLDPSAERRARAEGALREAVRLAPDAPETLMAQGVFEYRINNDWARALDYYREAERALPNDAELLNQIGAALRRLGRLPEAAAAFERAVALNPNDLGLVGTLVQTLEVVRNPRHVLATAERYLALFPDYAILRDYRIAAQFQLDGDRALYLRQLSELPRRSTDPDGRHQAYVNALRRGDLAAAARELDDPRFGRINLAGYRDLASVIGTTATGFAEPRELLQAYLAYVQGRQADAARFADQAIALIRAEPSLPRQEHAAEMAIASADAYAGRFEAAHGRARQAVAAQLKVDPYAALLMQIAPGRILVMAGRPEEALAVLREAIGRPQMPIPDNLRHDPIWSRLKDDPRFEEILRAAEVAILSRP